MDKLFKAAESHFDSGWFALCCSITGLITFCVQRNLKSMNKFTKDSQHRLFCSLFFICVAVFVASFAVIEAQWFRSSWENPSVMFVFTFWSSFVALSIVCLRLQYTAPLLAVIGWITAFILFLWEALTPKL
jgi:hypothetical protein